MPFRKIRGLLFVFVLLVCGKGFCQTSNSEYYYHEGTTPKPKTYEEGHGRPWKTSIDIGLVIPFAGTTGFYSQYVSGLSASAGYTFGLIEEIPIQSRSYIDAGVEILSEGVSFNSYFFEPGYSFLYDGNLNYAHNISMNEIQVPILYKFPLGPTDRKNRCIYMTAGWKWRYISYTYTAITDNSSGNLVWSGERDITSLYKIVGDYGSSVFEISIGYQRNTKKKRKRGWYMNLEYNYGLSPLVYTGNLIGSNDVIFHLNSLIFKIGKIF